MLFLALFITLSLVTFDPGDTSLNHVGSAAVSNNAGLFGAYLSGLLNDFFGIAAYAWPAFFAALGAGFVSWRLDMHWWRWCGYILLGLTLLGTGSAWHFRIFQITGGGMLGDLLYTACSLYLNPTGSLLLLLFVLLVGTQLAFDFSWKSFVLAVWAKICAGAAILRARRRAGEPLFPMPDWRRWEPALRLRLPRFPKLHLPAKSIALPHIVENPGLALSEKPLFAGPGTDGASSPDTGFPAFPDSTPVPDSVSTDMPAPAAEMSSAPGPEGASSPGAGFPSDSAFSSASDSVAIPVSATGPQPDSMAHSASVPPDSSIMPVFAADGRSTPDSAQISPDGRSTPNSVEVAPERGNSPDPVQSFPAGPVSTSNAASVLNAPLSSGSLPAADSAQAPAMDSGQSRVVPSTAPAGTASPQPGAPGSQAPGGAGQKAVALAEVVGRQKMAAVFQGGDSQSGNPGGFPEPASSDALPENSPAVPVVPVTEAENVNLTYDGQGNVVSRPQEGRTVSAGVLESAARLFRRAEIPFPSFNLLSPPKPPQPSREDREGRGRQLVACLSTFNVDGTLERITPGPVVTMYEYKPAPGVRVKKIESLMDDLKLAMKAKSIRIQAPIPGSDTVGIEIPNEVREMVNFREMLENDTFRNAKSPLTMVIGKDIAGRPFTADLALMPHLLVAGATGAGKSVCINTFLMSFLYKARPEDMQLLLVDPKRVELAVYSDLPHLVHPIVTEMEHAKAALEWAVQEMERRYDAMARMQVRNISGYNEALRKSGDNLPPDIEDLEPMPYLVIVIDEFADLMMTASRREVETSIVRLAQLARAAGIHMILATQRPSVDVVTGLIKANFPCRISFQVSQKVDSRTILDAMGAESLLGRGDMLFKPGGGRLLRMHGPFVSDDEVRAVVDYWKKQQKPSYKVDFSEWGSEDTASGGSSSAALSNGDGGPGDQLYAEILAFVNEQGKASISLIQRRFRIGFNKAARLFEQLERDGVVGPSDGSSKPRPVVK